MSEQTIYVQKEKTDPFARVPKEMLDCKEISWKAKGILSYLLSKPKDWKLRVSDICNHGPEGSAAVRAALAELRSIGYADLERKLEKGKVVEWVWKVCDSPIFIDEQPDGDFPHLANSDVAEPDLENRDHTKTNNTKKEVTKKEGSCAAPPEVEYWNGKGVLPKIIKWDGSRFKKLLSRRKDSFFMENWQAAIDRICQSKFCLGQVKSDRDWVADFDWFLKYESFVKIMEGRYDDKKSKLDNHGLNLDWGKPMRDPDPAERKEESQ